MKTIKLNILFILIIFSIGHSQTWEPLGQGTDGTVYTMLYFGDGLIVGGNFNSAGGVPGTRFIAKWNIGNNNWTTVGPPLTFTGPIFSITNSGFGMVAAGDFPSPGGLTKIARYLGAAGWEPLGNGTTDGTIWTLMGYGGKVYAGGSFSQIAGVPANKIAEWNGYYWHDLGSGTNGTVIAITGDTSGIYVGGSFSTAGGVMVNNIAKWNGIYWSALGQGLPNVVQALYLKPDGLLAGSAPLVKKWTGSNWISIGSTDTGAVYTISAKHGNIYAGGAFNLPGIIPANIAYFRNNWVSVGSMNYDVLDICEDGGVFAAGRFTVANGAPVNHIARLTSFNVVEYRIHLNKPILDNQRVIDTLSIPHDNPSENFTIADLNLSIDTVLHTNDDDLEFILSHESIRDTVIFRAGGSGDNFIRTQLNDSASVPISNGTAPFTGQFRPARNLSQFNGTKAGGDWLLEIYDRATGNTGIFEAWSLAFKFQEIPIGIQPISSVIPSQFSLFQNYPNPFNPSTTIKFEIPANTPHQLVGEGLGVRLSVYDILGRQITILVNEPLKSGTYEVRWNASNYPSGVYFYKLTVGDFSESKKMSLIK